MRLTAKTNINYGAGKDDKGNDIAPQMIEPGETFEFDDKKYPAGAKQLLESGDAVKAGTSEARAATAAATTPATTPTAKSGPLPDDFPGRDKLKAASINTYAQVRAADLTEIDGIGDATADKIADALKDD